jgi:5-methylcytosine-specific restriction endonuclease McrA
VAWEDDDLDASALSEYDSARDEPDAVTVRQWRAIVLRQRGLCAACGRKAKLTLDHIVPRSKGGSHAAHNIRPLLY